MTDLLVIAVGVSLVFWGVTWAYDRWVRPRIIQRWVDKTFENMRSGAYVPPVKQSEHCIPVGSTGFIVARSRPPFVSPNFIAWTDVVRIVAFKQDWWTVDCICLAIATADGTTTEVNEEMDGWEALVEALPKNLPGSKPWSEWFLQVAFPAFATNETLIFERTSLLIRGTVDLR
ncbi:MAG TPA: hypothetical protein VFE62_06515 [Gemmataceae bacterium]|nr:hypothetical protein [Gemmataceae bacterium]